MNQHEVRCELAVNAGLPVDFRRGRYSQVVSAINEQSPPAGAALSASPTAQAVLRGFLASSPDQRQQIVQELESKPESQPYFQQYVGAVLQVANTCNNF